MTFPTYIFFVFYRANTINGKAIADIAGGTKKATMQMDSFKHFVECVQDPDDDLCKAGILSARKVPAKRFFFDAWLDQLDEKAKRNILGYNAARIFDLEIPEKYHALAAE